jgi:outer membrane protein assembly factor BamB
MQRPFVRVGIVLACYLGLAVPAGADDAHWSRFRGPNGEGKAAESDIPVQWTEQSFLWKVPVPGLGNSSPVIWGQRLFMQSASKDGKERLLLCLSTVDGKTIWAQKVPGELVRKPAVHDKNSLASSTPAVDGERVFAYFWDGHNVSLHAFAMADGKPLWERELGSFTSQHGPATSPMVYQNIVFLANDQDGAAELMAFNAATGKDVWRAKRQAFRACYSVPLLFEKPGQPVELIVGSTAGLTSYEPQTGKVNWSWSSWPWLNMPLRMVASPVYTQGMFIASTGDGSGERNTTAIRPDGKGTLTPETTVWSKTKVLPYVPNVLTLGEHLYFVTDLGIACCMVARTGEVVWSERLGGNFSSSPIMIGDKIYIAGEDGTVHVFRAAPRFERLAKNALEDGVIATPAVSDHRLFVRTKTHLYCIGTGAAAPR